MEGMSLPWEGRLGRQIFFINAFLADKAIDLAMDAAFDRFFSPSELLSEDDDLPRDLRGPTQAPDLPEGAGAWVVEITRLGHAEIDGREYDAEYMLTGLTLASHFPHASPDAEDDPAHWAAARLARSERHDLSSSLSNPARPAARKLSL